MKNSGALALTHIETGNVTHLKDAIEHVANVSTSLTVTTKSLKFTHSYLTRAPLQKPSGQIFRIKIRFQPSTFKLMIIFPLIGMQSRSGA
jgi:hypothetical protein